MALIDKRSAIGGTSSLAFYDLPPTQTAIVSSKTQVINPRNAVDSFPILWDIPASQLFLDGKRSYVKLKMRITTPDGGKISSLAATPDECGTINYIGGTFFESMRLYCNNKLIFDTTNLLPYKAILDVLLNETVETKKSSLRKGLFVSDGTGKNSEPTSSNPGYMIRVNTFKKSREVEVIARIHMELFNQDKLLPNMAKYTIEAYPNRDTFNLMTSTDKDYVIELISAKLYAHMVECSPSFCISFEKALMQEPIKYPYRLMKAVTVHVSGERSGMEGVVLHNGVVPRRVILAMVNSKSYYGDIKKNPFRFQPFNIEELKLKVGNVSYPPEPLIMDFRDDFENITEAYNQLFTQNSNISSHGITFDEFKDGVTLFVQDLTPDQAGSSPHYQVLTSAPLTLDIRWRNPVPTEGIKVLAFMEFEEIAQFTNTRDCFPTSLI